jgi:hypothetical protein
MDMRGREKESAKGNGHEEAQKAQKYGRLSR